MTTNQLLQSNFSRIDSDEDCIGYESFIDELGQLYSVVPNLRSDQQSQYISLLHNLKDDKVRECLCLCEEFRTEKNMRNLSYEHQHWIETRNNFARCLVFTISIWDSDTTDISDIRAYSETMRRELCSSLRQAIQPKYHSSLSSFWCGGKSLTCVSYRIAFPFVVGQIPLLSKLSKFVQACFNRTSDNKWQVRTTISVGSVTDIDKYRASAYLPFCRNPQTNVRYMPVGYYDINATIIHDPPWEAILKHTLISNICSADEQLYLKRTDRRTTAFNLFIAEQDSHVTPQRARIDQLVDDLQAYDPAIPAPDLDQNRPLRHLRSAEQRVRMCWDDTLAVYDKSYFFQQVVHFSNNNDTSGFLDWMSRISVNSGSTLLMKMFDPLVASMTGEYHVTLRPIAEKEIKDVLCHVTFKNKSDVTYVNDRDSQRSVRQRNPNRVGAMFGAAGADDYVTEVLDNDDDEEESTQSRKRGRRKTSDITAYKIWMSDMYANRIDVIFEPRPLDFPMRGLNSYKRSALSSLTHPAFNAYRGYVYSSEFDKNGKSQYDRDKQRFANLSLLDIFDSNPKAQILFCHMYAVLCGEDADAFKFFAFYEACRLKQPELKIGRILTMYGSQGLGKTQYHNQLVMMVWGLAAGIVFNDPDRALGHFNELLDGRINLVYDEAYVAHNKELSSKLEEMATGRYIQLNRKNQSLETRRNFIDIRLLTNNQVCLSTQPEARRHIMLTGASWVRQMSGEERKKMLTPVYECWNSPSDYYTWVYMLSLIPVDTGWWPANRDSFNIKNRTLMSNVINSLQTSKPAVTWVINALKRGCIYKMTIPEQADQTASFSDQNRQVRVMHQFVDNNNRLFRREDHWDLSQCIRYETTIVHDELDPSKNETFTQFCLRGEQHRSPDQPTQSEAQRGWGKYHTLGELIHQFRAETSGNINTRLLSEDRFENDLCESLNMFGMLKKRRNANNATEIFIPRYDDCLESIKHYIPGSELLFSTEEDVLREKRSKEVKDGVLHLSQFVPKVRQILADMLVQ
jgi:hypothetical protein